MKVRELLGILKDLDPELEVVVTDRGCPKTTTKVEQVIQGFYDPTTKSFEDNDLNPNAVELY